MPSALSRLAVPIAVATSAVATLSASAGVVEFLDRDEWEAAVGEFTTIGFVLKETQLVSDQFAHLGVTFPHGTSVAFPAGSFDIDGWGLGGNPDIYAEFSQPKSWLAADFTGVTQFEFYRNGELAYLSGDFCCTKEFAGFIFSEPFDAVRIFDPTGLVSIDDLHFGPPIPGPAGGVILLTLAGVRRRTRV